MVEEYWYRFEDFREADYDPWAEYEQPSSSHPAIQLRRYKVLKETPKGVWIEDLTDWNGSYKGRRFINREWYKRFACPTLEEAEESFRARKAKQIRIGEAKIRTAKEALALLAVAKHRHGIPDFGSWDFVRVDRGSDGHYAKWPNVESKLEHITKEYKT